METIKKHSRLLQIKSGNKIIFEIKISKSRKNYHSFKNGLGIVSYCESLEECVNKTFIQMNILNEELKRRIITI